MLCDVSCNAPTILFTVTLTAVGLLVGCLSQTVLTRGFVSCLITCAAALLVCGVVQSFGLLFFQGQGVGALALECVLQALYSLIFCIPMYFIARVIARGIVPA